MAWAASKRKGFFLAEAAAACFVAAIFLAAIFSTLFISGAVVRKLETRMKLERQKRETLAENTAPARPGRRLGRKDVRLSEP